MKKRTFTRLLVLLLVAVLGLSGLVVGGAATAQAASGDALQSFLVEVKWSGWSSGSKTFMNGMTHEVITGWNVHCSYDNQDIANCKVCYCIEPGVHTSSGLGYTEKDEDYVVMQAGHRPFISQLKYYSDWGIKFPAKDFQMPDRSTRKVDYANRRSIMTAILRKHHIMAAPPEPEPEPEPEQPHPTHRFVRTE